MVYICSVVAIFTLLLTLDYVCGSCNEMDFPIILWIYGESGGKMEPCLRTTWLWVCPHFPAFHQNDQEYQTNEMEIRFGSRMKHQMDKGFNGLQSARWLMELLSRMKWDSGSSTVEALWELTDSDWVCWNCCSGWSDISAAPFPQNSGQSRHWNEFLSVCHLIGWVGLMYFPLEPWRLSSSVFVAFMQKPAENCMSRLNSRWTSEAEMDLMDRSDGCYMTDVSSCQADKGRVSKHAVF